MTQYFSRRSAHPFDCRVHQRMAGPFYTTIMQHDDVENDDVLPEQYPKKKFASKILHPTRIMGGEQNGVATAADASLSHHPKLQSNGSVRLMVRMLHVFCCVL